MRLYEAMFILNDARCAEDYNGTVERVQEIMKERGAEIVDSRKWDERKLAYTIQKQQRGTYVLVHFNAPPNAIAPIERQMRLNNDIVLRVLITVDEDGVNLGREREEERAAKAARMAEIESRQAAPKASEEAEASEEEATEAEAAATATETETEEEEKAGDEQAE